MSRQNRKSRGKTINPTFFVFCEGKTEELYINYLRTKYRLPIEIDAKIVGNRITKQYIRNHKSGKTIHPKDKTYLLYDLDAPKMLERLEAIPDTILLVSSPCFELWFLLHYQEQKAEITSDECLNSLMSHHAKYKKGLLDEHLKLKLESELKKAMNRASKLKKYSNPSCQVYKLIQELDMVKDQKRILQSSIKYPRLH